MTKHFRDLTGEEKASYSVTADARDDSYVYCAHCDRAMEQGDCVVYEDLDIKLACAYGDCIMEDNIASQNLYAWDSYRDEYQKETADWPDTPTPGECYEPAGEAP